jgi:transcription-repair coupling factor (superfamily II helicase)
MRLRIFQFQIPNSKFQIGINLEFLNLPSFESDVYANVSPHAETLEKRALALWNLTQTKPDFLIASAKSLITKTLAPNEIRNLGAHLKRDEDFAPEALIEKLVAAGYVA